MNIVNRLTLRHLKENRGRTVVTVLGIMVSVAMITAVFVSAASFLQFYGKVSLLSMGNYEAELYGLSQESYRLLQEDDRVERVGLLGTTEDYSSFLLEERISDRAGVGEFYVGDRVHLSQKLTGQYEGRIPENETEIAVEQSLIKKNKLDWKIGDEVSLSVGSRYYIQDDQQVVIGGSWRYGEMFETQATKKFRITAILHDNPATSGRAILRGMSEEEKNAQEVRTSVSLKKTDYKSLDVLKDMIKQYGADGYVLNDGFLESKFAVDENSVLARSILPMAAFVLALIIVASVVLIYNAFGMSVSERVRYLGMLASVGATRRQKRNSVYFEGALLGLVGIPAGILAGIVGIRITLKTVGNKIASVGMIRGFSSYGEGIETVVPLWSIVGIVIFSALTIYISAWMPARRASAVTPIEAIRQTKQVTIKKRNLRVPRYIRRLLGYEGELAYKNLKRNVGRSRLITFSIALSVILFLSVNYFCELFVQSNDTVSELPYEIQVIVSYSDRERLKEEVKELPGVDRAYICGTNYYMYRASSGDKNPNKELVSSKYLTNTYKNAFKKGYSFCEIVVEDEDFNKLAEKNGWNPADFHGESLKGVLLNNISHREGDTDIFSSDIIGQKYYCGDEQEGGTVEIGGLVSYDDSNYLCRLSTKNSLALYVPESMYYQHMYGDMLDEVTVSIGIETKEHKKTMEAVSELLESGGYRRSYCMDLGADMANMKAIMFVLQVFIYGFIALITLITAANIINTISTSIALRQKEFAMLQSVGITPAGFRRMICLESLFYGWRALAGGIPVSLLVCWFLNRILAADIIPFRVDIPLYLAVTAAVLMLVSLPMLYAVSRLKGDSIVETLKRDIEI